MKVAQLCLTLCDPMDYTVCGILQARMLEWVVAPFSKRTSQPSDQTQVSNIAGRFFTAEPPGKPIVQRFKVSSFEPPGKPIVQRFKAYRKVI